MRAPSRKAAIRLLSALMATMAVVAAACAATVTGSGFLDLSNVARIVLGLVALASFALAVIFWKSSHSKA